MKDQDKTKEQLISELEDLRRQVVERKRAEEMQFARTRLLLFANSHSLDELLEEALNEVEKLTDSLIGFYHFVESDQNALSLQEWSTRTKKEFCKAEGKGTHYEIAKAGVWVDCVQHRKPVIHNDYASLPHKKGLPPNHATVVRELVVPVMRANKIVAILGVGNKPSNYDEQDVKIVSLFADLAWDIVDRKRAEEALRKARDELEQRVKERTAELGKANDSLQQSHDELRTIYDNMVDGLLIADCATGRFLRTNPAVCQMLGYSNEELLAKSVEDIHPSEVVSAVLQKFWTQHEGEKTLTESRPMLRKDGTVFYADINTIRVSYCGRPCMIGLFRDMTDRKQAQEALRQSHDELRAIYDGMVDGLLIADTETKQLVRANPAICRMLGYLEEELLSKSVMDVHPVKDLPAVMETFQAQAGGHLRVGTDMPVVRKDGSEFFADIATNRLRYQDRPCLLGIFRDITERKQGEEALRRRHELEVSEEYARKRATELAEVDRRKDEFLAMLAHELRNPLAPIRSGIDVLRIVPPNSEQAKHILEMMEEQAHNLVRLIDDLLDVSRCTRGKLELRRQRVSLSKIITAAIHTAKPLIHAQNHELTVTQARESLHVHGDPTRLTQVVSNLLNNAAKYMHSGGKILLTTERIGNEVAIRVKDSGIGIASEMLPRIFEMFVQADVSLNRTHGGLGIGLTLVKSLVEMHGGSVEAASDGLGKGSEFTVRLPILQASDVVREEATDFPDVTRSFPCHQILVVDDVRPIVFILATLLRSFGQNVRTATNGAEALAMIEEEKPDLVLSDISMPEMTGYEFVQEIRRRPEWNDIRLVALSGYGQESDKKLATDAGFDSHMVKPVGKADLERLLASMAYLR